MHQHTHQQQPGQSLSQIDDREDEFGRNVDNSENRIVDKAATESTDSHLAKAERAHQLS